MISRYFNYYVLHSAPDENRAKEDRAVRVERVILG
jgi:hypothetical protein